VYDKNSTGARTTVFFFPDFINKAGFYNNDGVSDVTGAILFALEHRFKIKYHSSKPETLTQEIAEHPITLKEAIMKHDGIIFPVADLNARIAQIDNNPSIEAQLAYGDLI